MQLPEFYMKNGAYDRKKSNHEQKEPLVLVCKGQKVLFGAKPFLNSTKYVSQSIP